MVSDDRSRGVDFKGGVRYQSRTTMVVAYMAHTRCISGKGSLP